MGFDYIDFDNTLFDTTPFLLSIWKNADELNSLDEEAKVKYITSCDWNYILHNAPIINDGLNILKSMPVKSTKILTKVHSVYNEGAEKILFLRELEVKNEIILVPYNLKKTDVVNPQGNRLIDDAVRNLIPWDFLGGEAIFFNKEDKDIDEWGDINPKFQKIKSLSKIVR